MRITLDEFVRAESDINFANLVDRAGGVGKMLRDPRPLVPDDVVIVRQCFDFMYALGVFDLTCPVTLTIPESDRYLSLTVINQDHYVKLLTTDPGTYTLAFDDVGTRYVWVMYRIFVDASDESDIADVVRLQGEITAAQTESGTFEIPAWDRDDADTIRRLLRKLRPYGNGPAGAFGDVGTVEPVRRLVAAANGWAGIPDSHVRYVVRHPEPGFESVPHSLTVGEVPVDGFWSMTVYDGNGFVPANDAGVYSINNKTALANADGSVTIHFGGDGELPNRLEIAPGWNYAARLYLPRPEISDGTWKFPPAEPTGAGLGRSHRRAVT